MFCKVCRLQIYCNWQDQVLFSKSKIFHMGNMKGHNQSCGHAKCLVSMANKKFASFDSWKEIVFLRKVNFSMYFPQWQVMSKISVEPCLLSLRDILKILHIHKFWLCPEFRLTIIVHKKNMKVCMSTYIFLISMKEFHCVQVHRWSCLKMT